MQGLVFLVLAVYTPHEQRGSAFVHSQRAFPQDDIDAEETKHRCGAGREKCELQFFQAKAFGLCVKEKIEVGFRGLFFFVSFWSLS